MSPVSVLIFLVALLMVAYYVSRPFSAKAPRLPREDRRLSALLAEQDRLLSAIQDLDSDHALGKVPAAEYPSLRVDLLKAGADVLRRLDAHTGAVEKKPVAAAVHAPLSDDELEDLIAARRSNRKEKTGGFCPQCGRTVLAGDAFCPHCGHSLKKRE